MITGDRAVLSGAPGEPLVAAMLPGSHSAGAGSYQVIGHGNAALVVPVAALPYLGRGLSPNLFNISVLRQAERSGRLPVRIAYRGQRPALPGVHVTSAAAGSASGYLTLTAAKRFGAELGRLVRADHATDRYGMDGMFAGGLTIGLAGQPGSLRVRPVGRPGPAILHNGPNRPAFPMETLTIRAFDRFGQPDTGDMIEVTNVDNSNFLDATAFFDKGVAKLSVPVGNYWAVTQYLDFFDQHHPVNDWKLVITPDFTVHRSAATITVSERAARSEILMRTPRRAIPFDTIINLIRPGRSGPLDEQGFEANGISLWVNPTKTKPTVGKLSVQTEQRLASPRTTRGTRYEYNLATETNSGLIPPQHVRVRPSSLATVNARYFQDVKTSGSNFQVAIFPDQANQIVFASLLPFKMPRHQVEYMTGNPAIQWWTGIGQIYGFSVGGQMDALRSFHAGEVTDQNWNSYPLSPQPSVDLIGAANIFLVQPSAVRIGNKLALNVAPFSDSQLGHSGGGYTGGHFRITDNGKQVRSGRLRNNFGQGDFTARAPLSDGPSRVTFALAATRPPTHGYPLSSSVHAVWSWRSARQPRATLPKGWICNANLFFVHSAALRRCGVEPMMMLHYVVAREGLNGRTKPGLQQIAIKADQLPLATPSAITSLAVRFSVNGGKTWKPARVTRTGTGSYLAAFSASGGRDVTLRVRATDAAGGSVSETIESAYRTANGGNGGHVLSVTKRVRDQVRASGKPSLQPACPKSTKTQARCFALFAPEVAVNRAQAAGASAKPKGWGAKAIESAYKLPVGRASTQTVAIVDAFTTPKLAQSLASYRKQYGLPPCTVASGCLRIVNQKGKASPLPQSGKPFGWDVETALDVEMVSAACPHCHILLVEGNTADVTDLATAVKTAGRLGAQVISNSYGLAENGFVQSSAGAYRQRGHMTVVASGDFGFGPANFPANLAGVVSVGGTQLSRAHTGRGWSERVWNTNGLGGTASGCSAYIAKPSWQHDGHCPMRTLNDVSALAEGVVVNDQARGGWLRVDGTSAAAPIIAGVYGLAGNGASETVADLYAHAGGLFDVTRGNNVLRIGKTPIGPVCGGDYLCTAGKGYDAPTGLGTPDGITSF